MRYGLGIRLLVAFLTGGLAVLYKLNLNPRYKQPETSVVVETPRKFLFDLVTKPENVPKYFSWVTQFRESRFDKRNVSIGKRYDAIINLPFLGQHQVVYRISELTDGHWITLRPDRLDQSYFKTEVVIVVSSITKTQSQFQMKIAYHRTSGLFQMTVGRFLRWLTNQQLERIGTVVNNLAKAKWYKFRFPKGFNGTLPLKPPEEDPDISKLDLQKFSDKRDWDRLYRKTMHGEL
ncbi:Flavohemoprotein [Orchesella cincta]|uniref:Flavohemoprotein n=1 Tax=Orchesella cincta TaxID=48709 RepID=A0A1D2N6P0_ORCCI|nr:Flavohemoprotein [Orchesella cincta]